MGLFGVTSYSGDRRTVRAALDADGYEDELSRSLSDQASFVERANADEVDLCRVVKGCRAAAEAARARLDAAKRALAEAERSGRDLPFQLGLLLHDAKDARRRRFEHDGVALEDRRRTADLVRMAQAHLAATRVHDAMWAGFVAVADLLEAALGEAAPGHPLLAPAVPAYGDGSPRTGFDVVADAAHDVLATRHKLPTRAPDARGGA